MTHKSTSKGFSRRHKWLRYLLRKRPCFYMSICEVSTFILLSIAAFICVFFYISLLQIHSRFDAEDELLKSWEKFKTFAHCHYKELKHPHFNADSCGSSARMKSFAWRHHELKNQNEATCVDRHEHVECHEYISKQNLNLTFINKFSACGGVNEIGMGERYLSRSNIKQPRLESLKPYESSILHSSEVFVKCPICKKATKPFKWNQKSSKCVTKLSTVEYGWPDAAHECDNFLETSESKCDIVIAQ